MGLVDRRPVVCPTLAMGFWVPLHQRHAATTQPPVYSVSAYLHGLREAHASLTYGLNYGVEEIANVWRDWRCPCGHVNFRRRKECQLCSLSKMRPIAEAPSSCVLQ